MRADERRFAWELNQKNVPHVGTETEAEFARLCGISVCALVVDVDGLPSGFLLGMTRDADYQSENFQWFKERYDAFLYVDRLAVDAASRVRGAGTAMYRAAERFAREAGLPIVCCEVNVDPPNPGSLAFHGKIGFERVGEQMMTRVPHRVAMMVKRLST
jgi:predicted GNAT superfamily acetyltransferase